MTATLAFTAIFAAGCGESDKQTAELPEREPNAQEEPLPKTPEGATSGVFYTLQEAYDNHFLTQSDLIHIAYRNNSRFYNDEEDPNADLWENFEPTPIVDLSSETENAIRQSYWNESDEYIRNSATVDDVLITEYLGCYGKCAAVKMGISGFGVDCVAGEETVGGVYFFYSYAAMPIQIWLAD